MDTIVVGFDGSESSKRALARAAELAQALSARLVVVSVGRSSRAPVAVPVAELETAFVPSPVGGAMPAGQALPEPAPEQPEPKELAQRQLEQARMALARRQVEAEYVAEVGSPAERLLDVAEARGADLVVVGSPRRSLLERLRARPVDGAVARRAKQDVLLVR